MENNIETRSMLPVGTLLQGGKYRIERYLSSGGFGNTYVATNTEFEEQVAIKEFFMRGISQRDGDSVSVSVSNETNVSQFNSQKDKFRKEARRLRRLQNKHIVGVHDLFEENGTAYYEMDLIKGESLSERMRRMDRPFTENEVLFILDQVLDALSEVHDQGIFHLDLKPANIMIEPSGRVLLIDFGASKQMHTADGVSVSTSSALAFTPGYAPLEQTEQNIKSFGPWTDLYALGATIYRLLTNQTPPSASEILMNPNVLYYPTPVSPRMQELIAWMMKPRIDERPQSAKEVRNFLRPSAQNDEKEETEVVTPPTPPMPPTPPTPQRPPVQPVISTPTSEKSNGKRWLIPLFIAVAILLGAGSIGGWLVISALRKPAQTAVIVDSTEVVSADSSVVVADSAVKDTSIHQVTPAPQQPVNNRINSGNRVNTGRVNNTGTRINRNQNQGSRRIISTGAANDIVGGKRDVKPTPTDPGRKIDGKINSSNNSSTTETPTTTTPTNTKPNLHNDFSTGTDKDNN